MKRSFLALAVLMTWGSWLSAAKADMSEDNVVKLTADYFYNQQGKILTADYLKCSAMIQTRPDVDPANVLNLDCTDVSGGVVTGATSVTKASLCQKASVDSARGKKTYSVQIIPDLTAALDQDGHVDLNKVGAGDRRYCLVSQTKGQCFVISKASIEDAAKHGREDIYIEVGDAKLPLSFSLAQDPSAKSYPFLRPPVVYSDDKDLHEKVKSLNDYYESQIADPAPPGGKGVRELPFKILKVQAQNVSDKEIKKIADTNLEIRLRAEGSASPSEDKKQVTGSALNQCKAYVDKNSKLQEAFCIAAKSNRVKCPYTIPKQGPAPAGSGQAVDGRN